MTRVEIDPTVLKWAVARGRVSRHKLLDTFPKYSDWEVGKLSPTLRQLEKFARLTKVPFGYLFLTHPPTESLPIQDFRTLGDQLPVHPSPELLDTLYACQSRQDWYEDYAEEVGLPQPDFVGTSSIDEPVKIAAEKISKILSFGPAERERFRDPPDAFRKYSRMIENAGVLVMVNGVVENNTGRRLDPEEFRGFSLVTPAAPLIFVNGADAPPAQTFTLLHEFAHVLLGQSAISNSKIRPYNGLRKEERWCNGVAAEFLVPGDELKRQTRHSDNLSGDLSRLVKIFKVSGLVVIRRLREEKLIGSSEFEFMWNEEWKKVTARILAQKRKRESGNAGGGDFGKLSLKRFSRKLSSALVESVREGRTLYGDAFAMLSISGSTAFEAIQKELGVA